MCDVIEFYSPLKDNENRCIEKESKATSAVEVETTVESNCERILRYTVLLRAMLFPIIANVRHERERERERSITRIDDGAPRNEDRALLQEFEKNGEKRKSRIEINIPRI